MSLPLSKARTLVPDAELRFGVDGHFTLRVMKAGPDGEPIQHTAREYSFPNIITNSGMDSIGSSSTDSNDIFWDGCAVGGGSTPPQVTDTALQSQIAFVTGSAAIVQGQVTRQIASSPRWVQISRTWRFPAGAAAGNITEVGVRKGGSAPNVLFSRALVLDALGNPTSITVLSDEFLEVTYRFRWYIPESDVTGSVSLNGQSTIFTLRPVSIHVAGSNFTPGWPTLLDGSLANAGFRAARGLQTNPSAQSHRLATVGMVAMDATPNLTGITNGAVTNFTYPAYTPGSYFRDVVYTWGPGDGNSAGIQLAVVSLNFGSFQIGFSPAFTKNNTQQFRITLRVSWARRT